MRHNGPEGRSVANDHEILNSFGKMRNTRTKGARLLGIQQGYSDLYTTEKFLQSEKRTETPAGPPGADPQEARPRSEHA